MRNVSITKLSVIRRAVMLAILAVFMLQFARIGLLIGGLSGADIAGMIKMLDVFAFIETIVAARSITWTLASSVLAVILLYLIFGRSFCGWVCPYDLFFSWVQRIRSFPKTWRDQPEERKVRRLRIAGYVCAGVFLLLSAIIGSPFFTKYLSHLTNFFRMISTGMYYASDVPVSVYMFAFSVGIFSGFIILEFFFPRYFCRFFCPVGNVYGFFNKVSLLRLRFDNMETCTECFLCQRNCYMDVPLAEFIEQAKQNGSKTATLRSTDCIYCGLCVEHCGTQSNIKITMSN